MFAHGYITLPDYVAIGILLGNVAFLISLITYAISMIRDTRNTGEEERFIKRFKREEKPKFIVLGSNI